VLSIDNMLYEVRSVVLGVNILLKLRFCTLAAYLLAQVDGFLLPRTAEPLFDVTQDQVVGTFFSQFSVVNTELMIFA
jgi:hypothetical protein